MSSNWLSAGMLVLLASALAPAQQGSSPRGVIRAYGEATVSVRPDLARVSAGVVTQAPTANEAANRNADQTSAVIAALRSLLGTTADIRTVSYSLGPVYQYPPNGGQPNLNGFTANNVIEAVVTDLGLIGRVIDTAISSGANRVEGLRLGLKDEEPVKLQVLRTAGQKARLKAESIAQGVGIRVGPVVSVVEGYNVVPVTAGAAGGGAAATTPVVPGTLEVQATVTLEVEALP